MLSSSGLSKLGTFLENKVKFILSKKATKINEIFTVDLTLCSKYQIDSEDLVHFFGLLRKHELNMAKWSLL